MRGRSDADLEAAARAIDSFLRAVGAPVDTDPELAATGRKVASAFHEELLRGYSMDPAAILADRTESTAPGLVVVTDLPLVLMCPHHLMPAEGVAHVGYLPGPAVVGFGAIGRLVECFSRRLILQEALGELLVQALATHLEARGAGCVIDVTPSCFTARGGRHHGARTVTMAFAGILNDDASSRREFLGRVPRAR
jgi:GTP cyclohydrolase I